MRETARGDPRRHRNNGLRKICGCPRRTWAKCPHPWHFNFKWNGTAYRFSLDREVGHRLTTKEEARGAADQIRSAIRAGTFRSPAGREAPPVAPPEALTFSAFGKLYIAQFVRLKRQKKTWRNDEVMVNRVALFIAPGTLEPVGERAVGCLAEDDFAAFLVSMAEKGAANSTRNHYLQVFKSMSKWGVKTGRLTRLWIDGDSDLKRQRFAQRHRRLAVGEEAALLKAASQRMQRLIIGALETCSRQGELLSLQWCDVNLNRSELSIRAEHSKVGTRRTLPISSRLKAVLEMARLDPTGRELPPGAHVFGDEIGGRVNSVRKAWETCVLKAHGIGPAFTPDTHGLTAPSRAKLRGIDLHFRDLRHEGAGRLVEAGWPLHHVSEMLGHADLKTTAIYLNVTAQGLQESMRKLEESRSRCKAVASQPLAEHPLSGNRSPADARQVVVN